MRSLILTIKKHKSISIPPTAIHHHRARLYPFCISCCLPITTNLPPIILQIFTHLLNGFISQPCMPSPLCRLVPPCQWNPQPWPNQNSGHVVWILGLSPSKYQLCWQNPGSDRIHRPQILGPTPGQIDQPWWSDPQPLPAWSFQPCLYATWLLSNGKGEWVDGLTFKAYKSVFKRNTEYLCLVFVRD